MPSLQLFFDEAPHLKAGLRERNEGQVNRSPVAKRLL